MPKPRIYLDANPLIDAIKYDLNGTIEPEREDNVWHTKAIMRAALDGQLELVTSTLTIVECKRSEAGAPANEDTKTLINRVLTSGRIFLLAQVTQEITEKARDLEWVHGIYLSRAADAIHVATAIQTGCQEIFTGDGQINKNAEKLKALGLRVVRPSETTLLPAEYKQGSLISGVKRKPAAAKKARPKKRTDQ
ncbi:MAG: PIN domain-containing protein [Acidobacteria bacterium]|nr:PIN domain-containing protein [Acidobacteriota bacterium]